MSKKTTDSTLEKAMRVNALSEYLKGFILGLTHNKIADEDSRVLMQFFDDAKSCAMSCIAQYEKKDD